MGMFGNKSVLDMTDAEFEQWKADIERQREFERRFFEGTRRALAECRSCVNMDRLAAKIIDGF